MKTIIFLALAVSAVLASPLKDDFEAMRAKEREMYPRYISMTDGDGEPQLVDLEAPVDYDLIEEITRNPANTAYWLYTRNNPNTAQILTLNNANSVQNSNFNANRPTVFIAHGWLSNGNTEPNPSVRTAYLNRQDVNIITVDWRRLAMSDYATAALGVPAVGQGVGQFINWLNSAFGVRYDQVHLVGFSLGAHLVGNAGRATGGRVARVEGLDPAGPMWNYNRNRLSPDDGIYVEAIHTDGGYTVGGLGIGTAIAQVDFFPNGGISQPGCLTNICNHNRAWELFASSLINNHLVGNRCTSNLQITLNTCRGVQLRLGNDDLRKIATTGSYRLDTSRNYPY